MKGAEKALGIGITRNCLGWLRSIAGVALALSLLALAVVALAVGAGLAAVLGVLADRPV